LHDDDDDEPCIAYLYIMFLDCPTIAILYMCVYALGYACMGMGYCEYDSPRELEVAYPWRKVPMISLAGQCCMTVRTL
jgi:hypothetical protein